jgi:hypothetical protein
MRLSLSIVVLMLAALPAAAEIPAEVTTGRNAVLCLDRDNVAVANQPAVFRSQTVLRAMGCIRVGAGIPTRLLDAASSAEPVRVRFYPAGIGGGLELWALPSSFQPDRATLAPGPGV